MRGGRLGLESIMFGWQTDKGWPSYMIVSIDCQLNKKQNHPEDKSLRQVLEIRLVEMGSPILYLIQVLIVFPDRLMFMIWEAMGTEYHLYHQRSRRLELLTSRMLGKRSAHRATSPAGKVS